MKYSFPRSSARECLLLCAVLKFDLEPPILDIGYGAELFAMLVYPGKQVSDIDANSTEMAAARAGR
jgi:hypothetical protein